MAFTFEGEHHMSAISAKPQAPRPKPAAISVDYIEYLNQKDINDLCDATDSVLESGAGFGWAKLPSRQVMERYWQGVLVVPERTLIAVRVDGGIAGALQFIEPPRHNEVQSFAATLATVFVAPFARGMGCGSALLEQAEKLANAKNYSVINVDVSETQTAAIALYQKRGFLCWGRNPSYARINGVLVGGFYYSKKLGL